MKKAGYFITLIFFAMVASMFFFYTSKYEKDAVKKSAEAPKIISGVVEADETSINVKVPGKVSKIYVEEGQNVFTGQIIAKIEADNIDAKVQQAKAVLEIAKVKQNQAEIGYKAQMEQSDSQIKQAKAVVEAAEAQLNKAKAGARPQQLSQAKEVMEQAKKGYELSKSTYDRLLKLYNEGILPEQKIEMAKTDMEVSENRYNAASQQYDLVKEGAQKEDIQSAEALYNQAKATYALAQTTKFQVDARAQDVEAAKAQVLQAKATLDEVNTYVNDSIIKSPVSGTITMKSVNNGEIVSTGMPLVAIANLKSVWINVKVRESELYKYKLGDKIDVSFIGVPDKTYTGKISYISAKPSYATDRATQERGDRDIVAFAVKIKLENKDLKLRPGMTGTINIPAAQK